jgi:murein DD-endopeptidase MepM/ murein hydrolase activator NlpD
MNFVVRPLPTPMLAFFAGVLICQNARAATLKVSPPSPQPGDVLTVTIYPARGEVLKGIGMAAFDTPRIKFYGRKDGSARGFVGLPFDRASGKFKLAARVQVENGGREAEQVVSTLFTARSRYFPTQRISMNNSNAGKMSRKDLFRKEKARVQSKMQNSNSTPLWSGSWIIPCRGSSSSAYGRKRYVNGKWWGQHNGADIKAPNGARVSASNSGRVVLSEYLPTLRGNCIVIDHGCNVFSIYMHLSQRLVSEGDEVSRSQKIGEVGATGFVTGPHLHWEIRIGWEPVDPFKVAQSGLQF